MLVLRLGWSWQTRISELFPMYENTNTQAPDE
jgi:hypothetical protein